MAERRAVETHARRQPLRPRVMYVSNNEYPHDERTERICASLTARGHDVHLVAGNARWSSASERRPEGVVHRLRPWRGLGRRVDRVLGIASIFNPRWMLLLADTIRRVQPDVLVADDLSALPTAVVASKRFGVPVVLELANRASAAGIGRLLLSQVHRVVLDDEDAGANLSESIRLVARPRLTA